MNGAYARRHGRTRVVAAARSSQRSAPCFRRGESAAFDRIRTAIVRHRRDTGRDLRPRSHCTPGLSCATDARVCIELGSRAKTGLGARRSPQKAVSHRRRTKRRLAIAQRSRSASAHLRRRAHERPQPGAAPGCNPPFVTLSLGLVPGGIARSTASACRCGSFDDDAAERRRIRPMPNLNARDAA